jgi:hypothetical protein
MVKSGYDGNSNPLFLATALNTTVATVRLALTGGKTHQVLIIGEFSADGSNLTNGIIVGTVQVDGNSFLDTQVNNQNGNIGTIVTVTGIVTVPTGRHSFDLLAYTNASGLAIHHRALSVIDLG